MLFTKLASFVHFEESVDALDCGVKRSQVKVTEYMQAYAYHQVLCSNYLADGLGLVPVFWCLLLFTYHVCDAIKVTRF